MVKGPKCVNHIRELLDVPQPNVSQHLTVLRHSGLVAFYGQGRRRCYYLPRPALVKALFEFLHGEYPAVKPSREVVLAAVARGLEAKAAKPPGRPG